MEDFKTEEEIKEMRKNKEAPKTDDEEQPVESKKDDDEDIFAERISSIDGWSTGRVQVSLAKSEPSRWNRLFAEQDYQKYQKSVSVWWERFEDKEEDEESETERQDSDIVDVSTGKKKKKSKKNKKKEAEES